jgi:hypothetical protein
VTTIEAVIFGMMVDALCFVNGIFVVARSVGVRKDQLTSLVERCKSRTKCTEYSQVRSRIAPISAAPIALTPVKRAINCKRCSAISFRMMY